MTDPKRGPFTVNVPGPFTIQVPAVTTVTVSPTTTAAERDEAERCHHCGEWATVLVDRARVVRVGSYPEVTIYDEWCRCLTCRGYEPEDEHHEWYTPRQGALQSARIKLAYNFDPFHKLSWRKQCEPTDAELMAIYEATEPGPRRMLRFARALLATVFPPEAKDA